MNLGYPLLTDLISQTKVVNVKKGEKYDLYIGRANKWLSLPDSKWGNLFVLKRESEREEVLAKYREYILSREDLLVALPELAGKSLGCWCAPRRCHGNILIDLLKERYLNDSLRSL